MLCETALYEEVTVIGSVALLSHFHKVLALSKFAHLKCEIEVNPIAQIPLVTSTTQIEIRATGFTSISHFKSVNFESANTL